MKRTPAETRWERWQAAVAAARGRLKALTEPGSKTLSQAEVERRTKELGAAVAQRTVGRFIEGDNGTNVDTLFAILAVVPEAEDAFEASLNRATGSDADLATWHRLAARLSKLMDVDGGHRLVDAIEDLASLDALDDTWPHLRRPAVDIRQRAARREQSRTESADPADDQAI